MDVNYNLKYDYERVEEVKKINLSSKNPYELEKLANYILYGKQPTPTKEDDYLPLQETTKPVTTRYTAPRPVIPWHLPELSQLKDTRDFFLSLIKEDTQIPEAAQYRRWARETSQMAALIVESIRPLIKPKSKFPKNSPIEIDDYIDYTNSFHIKQLIMNYSSLRKSEESKFNMDFLDDIIEFAFAAGKLEDWQMHMIIRRIDQANGITIGVELGEQYNKAISPSYVSAAMRTVYRTIANAAKQMQYEYRDRNNISKWKKCPMCQKKLHTSKYFWHSKKKHCIQCEKKRKENMGRQKK